jgi:hypothetical protein
MRKSLRDGGKYRKIDRHPITLAPDPPAERITATAVNRTGCSTEPLCSDPDFTCSHR